MKKTTATAKSKAQKKTVTKVAARRVSALPAKKTVKKVASKPAAKPVVKTVKKTAPVKHVAHTPNKPARLVDNSSQGFMVFLMIAVLVFLCFLLITNYSNFFKKPVMEVENIVTTEVKKIGLVDHTWVWVATTLADGETVVPEKADAFTLDFKVDGSLAATTDCNDGHSSYTDENGVLAIKPVAATLKYCLNSQETVFYQELGTVESYATTADGLVLNLADGAQMTFAPKIDIEVNALEATATK